MTGSDAISCFACGHQYHYLGWGLHPGRCPACESHCVSPAGELTVLDTLEVGSSCSGADVGVLATDEKRRQFLYFLDKTDGSVTLSALKVGGHLVQTAGGSPEALPAEVLDAVASREPPRTTNRVQS